jgi:DivIVA domain-containing protein
MPDQSSAATEHALMQEITAPLQRLPDDASALVQAEFPTVMRGYDRHAVDDYVEQVGNLVAELQATRSPEAAVRRALERVGEQIAGILQRAHETAEQITAQSRGEAEDRMEQARREGAAILDAAQRRVRDLDADCDRIWAERQRIVADAEDLSGQLLAVARDAAERFPAEEVRPFGAQAPSAPDAVSDDESVTPADELAPAEEADEELARTEEEAAAEGEFAGDEEDLEVEELIVVEQDLGEDDELDAPAPRPRESIPEVERTLRYRPEPPPPRRAADEDSTQIIPPASDAAQHRHED